MEHETTLAPKQIIRIIKLHIISDIELEEPYLSTYNDLKCLFNNLNSYKSTISYFKDCTFYGITKNKLFILYNHKTLDIELDYSIEEKLDPYSLEIIEWFIMVYLNINSIKMFRYKKLELYDVSNSLV